MADSRLADTVKYKYDVFISYKSGDDERIARQVAKALTQSKKNFKVIAGWEFDAFPPGRTTLECIGLCVEQSWRTLVILTPNSIKSNWVLLELLEAVEQSKNSNVLTLRLLLQGVPEHDIKFLKCGMLAEVPHFNLDFNRDSWPDTLLQNITNETPLTSILSVGSGLAHGLVFSHYVGFLSHVLPVLAEKIEKSDVYKTMSDYISKKYYLLLPGSCQILDNLESYDPETDIRIVKFDEFIEFDKEHAGKPRTFKLSIYKITKHLESFYFIADCPHVLKAICQLDELDMADKRFQIAKFYYILNEVVNHAENYGCYDTVRLIVYNEKAGESMQTALFNYLAEDIPSQVIQRYNPEWTPPIQRLMSQPCDVFNYDVTISYLSEQPEDMKVGQEIEGFLTGNQMNVYVQRSGRNFHLPSAKWHIFVLSKETVHNSNYVKTLCFGALYQSLDDNQLRVLPVVVGIKPEAVPRVIKCVTVVKASEQNYCQQLLKTMKGGNIKLEQILPAGEVATGLAWAYVINYLKITLLKQSPDGLDLVGRIQQCLRNKSVSCGCIYKMFVIVPKSCDADTDFIVKANEKPKSNDGGLFEVEWVDKLSPVYENTGGQQGRPFYLHMYKYTDLESQQSKYFIAEYSTPHKCLREMAYSYPFAGLNPDDMCVQGKRIVELVPQILRNETIREKYADMTKLVEFVYYDDETESLIEALRRHFHNQPLVNVDDASHHSNN